MRGDGEAVKVDEKDDGDGQNERERLGPGEEFYRLITIVGSASKPSLPANVPTARTASDLIKLYVTAVF